MCAGIYFKKKERKRKEKKRIRKRTRQKVLFHGYRGPGFAHHLNKWMLSSVNGLLEVAASRPRNFSPSPLLHNVERQSSLVSHSAKDNNKS